MISSEICDSKPTKKACRCGSMRRKPLFPPPKDPTTQKNKHNKGLQDYTILTVNGRVRLRRRRWHSPGEGSTTPLDVWLDAVESTISVGVREMACRLNGDGKSFDKAAANLERTAQVQMSGETLRTLVEAEGKQVVRQQQSGQLPVNWSAADCQTFDQSPRCIWAVNESNVQMVAHGLTPMPNTVALSDRAISALRLCGTDFVANSGYSSTSMKCLGPSLTR